MALIEVERKSRVLRKAQFGCLRGSYALNVTRGCEFMCVYCYARGYPEAPASGEVQVYGNLPEKLADELDNPRRRSTITWVIFNTASDSFQNHPRVVDITYRTMQVLLDRGIGFSFLTKGWIPDRFLELFSMHSALVTSRIGLVSMNPRYRDLFEPNAAKVSERLDNIDRLKRAGIDVEVRIDPIIPFFTDDERSIEALYKALADHGVRTVSLSYLHMRPAVLGQLEHELPPTLFRLLESCFKSRPWTEIGCSTRSKMVPPWIRQEGYRRFIELSKPFGITALICGCKNPDISAHKCISSMPGENIADPTDKGRQLSFFSS